jgi:hypothetical protein
MSKWVSFIGALVLIGIFDWCVLWLLRKLIRRTRQFVLRFRG